VIWCDAFHGKKPWHAKVVMSTRSKTTWAILAVTLVATDTPAAPSSAGYSNDGNDDSLDLRQARAGFRTYDANHDGYISFAEFAAQKADPRAFSEADANKDGRLSLREYIKAQSIDQRIKSGNYFDDAWITARVKADLLKDSLLDSLPIGVETQDGVVQLSGEVRTSEQASHVIGVASAVGGVKSVHNGLVIR
jgi:osmotically-inducible protein OsmY